MSVKTISGVVPISYVNLLYDYLSRQGRDAARLLGEPAPDAENDRLARYPVVRWKSLLEKAARELDDPLLGLHLGQQVHPGLFGALGYVLLACPNLGAALQRLEQYHQLVYDVNPLVPRNDAHSLVLGWGVERGRPGPLVDEFAITALIQFARDITGRRLAPQQVWFVNPAPADLAPYEAFFAAPVHFGQSETRLYFDYGLLASTLRQPDETLLQILESQVAAQLAELAPTGELEHQVRGQIVRLCRDGGDHLPAVASALCLSGRTLRRHLAAAGLSFRELQEDTRRRLAEDYLRDPRLHLSEIALLLGYSAQSAFNRAFLRWTGQTPRQYRQARRPPGDPDACRYS